MSTADTPLAHRLTAMAREVVQDGSAIIGLLGRNTREATVKVTVANGKPVRRRLESETLKIRVEQDGDWTILHVTEKGS